MNSNVTVSIIIVSYNTWHYLKPCIESILSTFGDTTYEIIIVDNDSTDGSQRLIKKYFPEIVLIENQTNTGFAKANNQALDAAQGDFLFLLNADTVIKNSHIDSALEYMIKNNIALLGPKLINDDGSHQISYDKKNDIRHYITNIFSMALHFRKFRKPNKRTLLSPENVSFLVGAALLLRSKVVKEYGLFDETFYFTGEERDLCLRYKKAGKRIVYYPDWLILHYGGSGNPHSLFQITNWCKASLQLAQKHGGYFSSSFMRIGLSMFLLSYLVSFICKYIISPKDTQLKENALNYLKAIQCFLGTKEC